MRFYQGDIKPEENTIFVFGKRETDNHNLFRKFSK